MRSNHTIVDDLEDEVESARHHVHQPRQRAASAAAPTTNSLQTRLNILAAMAFLAFLYFARGVVLPILLAIVAAMALKPVMKLLGRWHVPKALGATIIVGALLCVVTTGFVELSLPAMKWISNAPQHLTELKQRLDRFMPIDKVTEASSELKQTEQDEPGQSGDKKPATPILDLKNAASPGTAINWTAGFLGGGAETLILLFMFIALGDKYLDQVLDGQGTREKKRAWMISDEIQQTISRYLFTVTMINLALGIAVATALFFLHVPNAALWGLLAAALNYILYFGPIVGIAIVAVVGLVTSDSLVMGLLPAGAYLALHIAEADFITPILLGRKFTISPLVIFVFLIFATWLWGVLGALLAVPLLISIKVICQQVPALAFARKYL